MDLAEELERLERLYGKDALTDACERRLSASATVSVVQEGVDLLATMDVSSLGEPAPRPPKRPVALPTIPDRYEDLGRIGVGGMGEVRRVRDRELGRVAAFKVIRADLVGRAHILARFVEEAQVAAQLQHPNIAPVYDAGRLPDGRCWFTMKEVRGRTLSEVIREDRWSLHRLVDAFAKVCDGVGYAHARGVVHRDLKPDNVMVGEHGECLVLDWGLAKVIGRAEPAEDDEPEVATARSLGDDSLQTRVGGVIGTPAYMPPEQARGEVARLDARSDVYSLGAMLYEVLAGRQPFQGRDSWDVLRQVLTGQPPPLDSSAPAELVELCERCMSREPSDRPADGSAVAAEVRAWLDGARKREKALALVEEAVAVGPKGDGLRAEAASLRAEAAAMLVGVQPWEPEDRKAAAWELQDRATAIERQAGLLGVEAEGLLYGALGHDPTSPDAHAGLVETFQADHRAAEADHDPGRAAPMEIRLRTHTQALPADHPARRRATAYLRGDGALTLRTDPPGAEVFLERFEAKNRRLVPVPMRSLGRTPLEAVPLPMGSYRCVLRHPERADVVYPVHIGRGEHWDGVAPGETEPRPVRMPLRGELGADDCLVPAGWYWSGGAAGGPVALPLRRLWCDDLVVSRFSVTNRQYLRFLDALVSSGREELALRVQPRERAAGEGSPSYGRDAEGRFALRADADGDIWDPDWPVFLVDILGASAYAAWLAEETSQPWRLPGELEWEKAARGVDGRLSPWGDYTDPSWSCMRHSHPQRPLPGPVHGFPVDESPYGVRGTAGNVQDWCGEAYRREGPPIEASRVRPTGSPDVEALLADLASGSPQAWAARGGSWTGAAAHTRCAARGQAKGGVRNEDLGFRVVRTP